MSKKKTSLMKSIESCLQRYASLVDNLESSPNIAEVLGRADNIYRALAVLSFSIWDYDKYNKLEQLILKHDERRIRKGSVRIREILAIAYRKKEPVDEEKTKRQVEHDGGKSTERILERHFNEELAARIYRTRCVFKEGKIVMEHLDPKTSYTNFKEGIEERLNEYLPEKLKACSKELADNFVDGMQQAMIEGLISVKSGQMKKFGFLEKIGIIAAQIIPLYIAVELIGSTLNIPTLLQVKLNEGEERREYGNYNLMLYKISKPDPELGFVLTPNSNLFFGSNKGITIDLQTDEHGFLKGEAEKNGSFTVVGDSFAFGFGVRKEDAWPNLLEKQLGEEVTNFGVYGYALWQYNTLMRKFKQFEDKIILYGVYTNDFYVDESRSNPQTYYKDHNWDLYQSPNPTILQLAAAKTSREDSLFKRTFTHKCLQEICRQASIGSFVNELCALYIPPPSIIDRKSGVELTYSGAEEKVPQNEDEVQKAISDLHKKYKEAIDITKQNCSRLVVVLFSSKNLTYREMYAQAFGTDYSLQIEEVMREETKDYFKRKGIPVIDVREALERKQKEGNQVFLKRDRHLNEYGNLIVARRIACFLGEHGYVKLTNKVDESCTEKPTLKSVVTSGIIHLDEIDF